MMLESIGQLGDGRLISLPAVTRWSARPMPDSTATKASYTT